MDINQIKNFIENLGLGGIGGASGDSENSLGSILQMAKPFLENLLNIDNEAFDTIIQLIPKLLAGEIDFKKLLPLALPILLTYFSSYILPQKKSTEQNCSVEECNNEEINEELKNISPEAFSQLAYLCKMTTRLDTNYRFHKSC